MAYGQTFGNLNIFDVLIGRKNSVLIDDSEDIASRDAIHFEPNKKTINAVNQIVAKFLSYQN